MQTDQTHPVRACLAEVLGRWSAQLSFAELPQTVVEKIRTIVFLDLVMASGGYEAIPEIRQAFAGFASNDDSGARIFGSGMRLSPGETAFVNAAMMHARTQDDFQHSAHAHIGAATIPAALALCDTHTIDAEDFVAAIAVGYQVATALAVDAAPLVGARGFRPSGVFAVIGAAAALARLLKLDAAGCSRAIALAGNCSAGLNQAWVSGSDDWRLHLANASQSAINCAILAMAGHSAPTKMLEGDFGVFNAFTGQPANMAGIVARLNDGWAVDTVGFKRFPICGINLGPADHALMLRADGAQPETVAQITVSLPTAEAATAGIASKGPINGLGAAQMRTAFVVAQTLCHGALPLSALINRDPDVVDFADKIAVVADPELAPMSHRFKVQFTSGEVETYSYATDPAAHQFDPQRATDFARGLLDELVLDAAALDRLATLSYALGPGRNPRDLTSALILNRRDHV